MIKFRVIAVVLCVVGLLGFITLGHKNALAEPANQSGNIKRDSAVVKHNKATGSGVSYTELEWTDLISQEDLEALLNPPEYIQNIEDGSDADTFDSQVDTQSLTEADQRYRQALKSVNIKSEFNNRTIRIPGFIVPLEFDDAQTITTFFLVPYFGACLHMPPPPPNQIIYAEYEPGIKLESLYDPFWVEGTLSTTLVENDLATAAYSMIVDGVKLYLRED